MLLKRLQLSVHSFGKPLQVSVRSSPTAAFECPFVELLGRAMRNRFNPPLVEDSDKKLEGEDQAAALLNNLKLSEGRALPKTYTTDFNMKTGESFSRIFFTEWDMFFSPTGGSF